MNAHPDLPLPQTTNLIINLDHDEWIFEDESQTLADLTLGQSRQSCRVSDSASSSVHTENESEVSFFNREAYEEFKKHPDVRFNIFSYISE